MQYKSPVPQHGILNLTPLIDIVFLLLVFFMLTAHFVEEKQIALQLPTAASSETLSNEEVVTIISIDQTGIYHLSGKPVHADVLQSRLKEIFTQSPKLILQLKADHQVSYEKVVHVLDSARIVGIDNMDIVTEAE